MLIALLIALATGTGFHHTSAFDKQIAILLQKATVQCVELKTSPVDDQQIRENTAGLETELEAVTRKYFERPPARYKRDVNWKSYFVTLSGDMEAMDEQLAEKQFDGASIYCADFSNTIGQMHKISGTTNLADVARAWHTEIKNTTDMYNAGNIAGYEQNLQVVENIYQKLVSMKVKHRKNLNKRFNPLRQTYTDWLKAIRAGDTNAMNMAYQRFTDGFTKPYLASLKS
jgi:hypothetical protein